MKKTSGIAALLVCLCVMTLAGCMEENTAVVSTTDMPIGGLEGKTVLIDTDDPSGVEPVVIDTPGLAVASVRSRDEKQVFIAQRRTGNDVITVLNAETQEVSEIAIEKHLFHIRHIWDMAVTEDGGRLVVGTRNTAKTSCWIEIYDSVTFERVTSFKVKRSLVDYYRKGEKLVVNPVKDEIYVMVKGDSIQPVRIRTLDFSGNFIGEDLKMNADYWDYNYGFGVSSNGKLLIGVSDKIYPYEITDSGLTVLPAIGGKDDEDFNYYGKINVLFSEDFDVLYVTSSGVHIPGATSLGGVCTVLDVDKVLAGDEDPFIFSLVDFVYDDFIQWVAEKFDSTVGDLIDPLQLYGIADACILGNTCYMVIASVAGLGTDMTDVTDGKYILSAFQTVPFGGQVWIGGKVLDQYPGSLTVNGENDTLVVTYPWKKSIDILKKKPTWLTPKATRVELESIEGLGNATYPKGVEIGSVKRN